MLVLSKVYLVTKGALVPEMAALGMLDEAGAATAAGGDATAEAGSAPRTGRPPGRPNGRAAAAGPIPPLPTGRRWSRVDDPGTGTATIEPDLATLNARLGLLASLSASPSPSRP